jgi:hypothetical protein
MRALAVEKERRALVRPAPDFFSFLFSSIHASIFITP